MPFAGWYDQIYLSNSEMTFRGSSFLHSFVHVKLVALVAPETNHMYIL